MIVSENHYLIIETHPRAEQLKEKLIEEIDNCSDVEALQQMCKFLVKLEMKTRETYSIMIEDLMTK